MIDFYKKSTAVWYSYNYGEKKIVISVEVQEPVWYPEFRESLTIITPVAAWQEDIDVSGWVNIWTLAYLLRRFKITVSTQLVLADMKKTQNDWFIGQERNELIEKIDAAKKAIKRSQLLSSRLFVDVATAETTKMVKEKKKESQPK